MKLLMVSINSIHFHRWVSQLEGSGYEVHWFDVSDGREVPELHWLTHHRGWRYKGGSFRGRTFLKRRFPGVHRYLENDLLAAFSRVLKQVEPDVVHSFVLYKSAAPILPAMRKQPHIKWIYSSWGSDLYLFRQDQDRLREIETVLPQIDFMFSDTRRDARIAKELGFAGTHLGVFPGGGGFQLHQRAILPPQQRDLILIKGYQGRSGRALQVLEALLLKPEIWQDRPVIVFGASPEVEDMIHAQPLLKERIRIGSSQQFMAPHEQVLDWMAQAAVYIGNSDSDGMPNTLLEALIMGAFPIQSNPGGATAEVIEDGQTGLLIEDPMDPVAIAALLERALSDSALREQAFEHHQGGKQRWAYPEIRKQVLSCYQTVARSL